MKYFPDDWIAVIHKKGKDHSVDLLNEKKEVVLSSPVFRYIEDCIIYIMTQYRSEINKGATCKSKIIM
jgi:hypothetical protein